ncbi:hypothetical protein [Metabacillus sp. cB07]|uniref:hypothetical protein n=1 Tax=Metabacillus sp. cB07 TaxID=2806989 RepID=UPI001939EA5B|nr:hypothetical protein [Metabacillus sp. cB07]
MKTTNRRFVLVLSIFWLFTLAYTADYIMKLGLFQFADWTRTVFSPVIRFILGGMQ